MPKFYYSPRTMYGDYSLQNRTVPFSVEEAKALMLRPGSKLRTITLGDTSYSVSGFSGHLSVISYFFYLSGKMGARYT